MKRRCFVVSVEHDSGWHHRSPARRLAAELRCPEESAEAVQIPYRRDNTGEFSHSYSRFVLR